MCPATVEKNTNLVAGKPPGKTYSKLITVPSQVFPVEMYCLSREMGYLAQARKI